MGYWGVLNQNYNGGYTSAPFIVVRELHPQKSKKKKRVFSCLQPSGRIWLPSGPEFQNPSRVFCFKKPRHRICRSDGSQPRPNRISRKSLVGPWNWSSTSTLRYWFWSIKMLLEGSLMLFSGPIWKLALLFEFWFISSHKYETKLVNWTKKKSPFFWKKKLIYEA